MLVVENVFTSPEKSILQDQGVPGTFDCGHVDKVNLPISFREGAASLVGRKIGAIRFGVGV